MGTGVEGNPPPNNATGTLENDRDDVLDHVLDLVQVDLGGRDAAHAVGGVAGEAHVRDGAVAEVLLEDPVLGTAAAHPRRRLSTAVFRTVSSIRAEE